MTLKDVARVDRFKIFQQFVILASDRYDLEVRDAWNRKFGHSKTTEDAKTVEKKKFVSANDDLVDVALAVEYDTMMILMMMTDEDGGDGGAGDDDGEWWGDWGGEGSWAQCWGRPQQSINLLPSQRQCSLMCKLQQAVGQSAVPK